MKWLVPLLLVLGGVAAWLLARSSGAVRGTSLALEPPVESPREVGEPSRILREPETPRTTVAREAVAATKTIRAEERPIVGAPANTRPFHGLVLDALTQAPIEGARALLSSSKRNAPPSDLAPEEIEVEARSDAAGRFQLALPERGALGVAQLVADGYGSISFVHDLAHAAPERAEVIELLPAASLEVRVLDPKGSPKEGVAVELSPPPILEWRDGMHIRSGRRDPWPARTDADGRALFEGLPAEAVLAWTVSEPAGSGMREGQLALAPGERRRLDVVLGGTARVFGRVRDDLGAPVRELTLDLAREGYPTRKIQAVTVSDASGAFEFGDVAFGTYRLSCGEDVEDFVAHRETLVVDRERTELELVLTRGLSIAGRVVANTGDFDEHDSVSVWSLDGVPLLSATLDESAFRVGPLAPGEYLVGAQDGELKSEVVRASAGTSDLELRVQPPVDVRVRVQGTTGAYQAFVLDLQRQSGAFWGESSASFTDGFAPGAHALIFTTPDGRLALLPRLVVESGVPHDEVVLDLQTAARCTLVHRATEGTRSVRLLADGEPLPLWRGLTLIDELLPGASETVLVPAGALTAELVEGGRVVDSERFVVAPGERRRIELTPR